MKDDDTSGIPRTVPIQSATFSNAVNAEIRRAAASIVGQVDQRHAAPALPGPGLLERGHTAVALQAAVQMVAQAPRAVAVDDVQHVQTGGNGQPFGDDWPAWDEARPGAVVGDQFAGPEPLTQLRYRGELTTAAPFSQ